MFPISSVTHGVTQNKKGTRLKEFDKWNEVKKTTEQSNMKLSIKSREIYWTKIGQNIGNEQYGKGEEFTRPVIVIRQLTSDLFVGVPTTSATKENNDYFHNINYTHTKTKDSVTSSAMILQVKVFSKKRVLNKIGTVNKIEFNTIVDKLKLLVDPT
jgi:mRNA interferase MazF